jgi:hypothetical protein
VVGKALGIISLTDTESAFDLLRSMIEARTFRKERLEDPDVSKALAEVGNVAAVGAEAASRLKAVSLLGKAGEVSKPIAAAVQPYLEHALEAELPPVGNWGNAVDRYYLAKAVETSAANWIPKYAAQALAQAEISERLSRDKWAELAINRAHTLTAALSTIASAFRGSSAGREGTIDFAYRKLVRICEALTQTLLTADVPTGEGFGRAFAMLIQVAGGGKGAETLRVREEAAHGVLDLVMQLLRLRFETLFDSDLYRAVGTVRGWWRPARPPDEVERRADRIVRFAMQGLHILARQGVRDVELRRTLVTALDAARVNSAGHIIATSDISLDPTASKWLATGQVLTAARSNEAVQALNEDAIDELLGRLMVTVVNHDVSAETLDFIADAIELFEPAHAITVRRARDRLALIRQWVDALAAKRRLTMYGTRGDIVQYDPALHETAKSLQRLSEVRIAVPGILRTPEARPSTIVIKATVESSGGDNREY